MQGKRGFKTFLKVSLAATVLFFGSREARGQDALRAAASGASAPESSAAPAEIRALAGLVRDLESQVQTLNSQLGDLRAEQERASTEAQELRHELDLVRAQVPPPANAPLQPVSTLAANLAVQPAAAAPLPAQTAPSEDRLAKLEESQEVLEGKINDQYQTKVESGSKYRLRLSGIVLLNLFENRGSVDNIDYPEVAESAVDNQPHASPGTFGGSLRQSQIRLQAF